MFVCILLIATVIPAVGSLKNSAINATVPSTLGRSIAANWTEIQKLIASDGAASDYFGCSVSLSGDTALIGASYDDNHQGSAYVFIRNGTTWTQQAKLLASDGTALDYFGQSVSLDGDTALIGAENYNSGIGSAYVFTRTGTTWTQQAQLNTSNGAIGYFGYSVSLSGNTTLIGAPNDNDNGNISGSAYVFTRTNTTWSQQAKLLASDGATNDGFGVSVSLSDNTALIGAYFDHDNGAWAGSAYVFTRDGITWAQQAELFASDGAFNDRFGFSVSLAGGTALIGACYDDDNGVDSGSAYVFTRTGTTWTQQQKLLASDGATRDTFGYSVSLDGDTALIGAYYDYDNGEGSGSAYVFTRTGTTWTQQAKLLASDGATGDAFGYSVSLDGDTVLIGAVYDDDNGLDSGSVYVFKGPNQPPNPPTITGPTEGKVGIAHGFNITTIDPDGDEVYYFIDWGDNTTSGWLGPFTSGQQMTVSHTWDKKGEYLIKSKAKDVSELESNWSDPNIFNVYELKKAFLFGRYTNMSTEGDYIIVEAVNLRMILFTPFEYLHYIAGEKITFSNQYNGIIANHFLIGMFNVKE